MTPNKIEFRSTSDNTWVMRITSDRKIEVNEDVDVTFAAQKVLDAMQGLLTPQHTWVELTDEEILEVWKENEKVYPMDRSRLLDRTRACIRKASK